MDKKKVLVLGATGMAGHVVYYFLKESGKYQMSNVVFRTKLTDDSIVLDVRDSHAVKKILEENKPDVIINCIGVLVRGSQEHPDNAILLNAYFPHLLERIACEISVRVIHISTDCVFSGQKGYYNETDFRDADDVYGRSKALGEIMNSKDLTIRTSIIGPELKSNGEGLFHWFMHQHGGINGFKTAIWGGVTTLELAKMIDYVLDRDITGLVQLSNGVRISKYDVLNLFKEVWGRTDITVLPYDGNGVDKSIARSEHLNYHVPEYREMLEELEAWMEKHGCLYQQYK